MDALYSCAHMEIIRHIGTLTYRKYSFMFASTPTAKKIITIHPGSPYPPSSPPFPSLPPTAVCLLPLLFCFPTSRRPPPLPPCPPPCPLCISPSSFAPLARSPSPPPHPPPPLPPTLQQTNNKTKTKIVRFTSRSGSVRQESPTPVFRSGHGSHPSQYREGRLRC